MNITQELEDMKRRLSALEDMETPRLTPENPQRSGFPFDLEMKLEAKNSEIERMVNGIRCIEYWIRDGVEAQDSTTALHEINAVCENLKSTSSAVPPKVPDNPIHFFPPEETVALCGHIASKPVDRRRVFDAEDRKRPVCWDCAMNTLDLLERQTNESDDKDGEIRRLKQIVEDMAHIGKIKQDQIEKLREAQGLDCTAKPMMSDAAKKAKYQGPTPFSALEKVQWVFNKISFHVDMMKKAAQRKKSEDANYHTLIVTPTAAQLEQLAGELAKAAALLDQELKPVPIDITETHIEVVQELEDERQQNKSLRCEIKKSIERGRTSNDALRRIYDLSTAATLGIEGNECVRQIRNLSGDIVHCITPEMISKLQEGAPASDAEKLKALHDLGEAAKDLGALMVDNPRHEPFWNWTRELPTAAGWYWNLGYAGAEVVMVYVEEFMDKWMVGRYPRPAVSHDLEKCRGDQWFGPISAPAALPYPQSGKEGETFKGGGETPDNPTEARETPKNPPL